MYLVEAMRARGRLDGVADITVAYPANLPRAEEDLLAGRWPRVVDFFVDHFPQSELPQESAQLANWLNGRWSEKERFLKWYYTELHASEQQQEDTVRYGPSKEYKLMFRTDLSFRSLLVTAFMTLFAVAVVVQCFLSWIVLTYAVVVLLLSVPLTLRWGGWDKIMVNYNWLLTQSQKQE